MRNPVKNKIHNPNISLRIIMGFLIAIMFLFLAFYHLTSFPKPWFDEGSYLHVPKTLVRFGVYADYSSEGFRYYGPTIGVGPTVMLPVAAIFWVFGIGLLQARVLMAVYLLAAIYVFYRLVRDLSLSLLAWVALALLISSRSVLFLEYGRQLLGEVPGFFFLVLAVALWFKNWGSNNWIRLMIIGLFFGLAIITKYQYLLFVLPMIGLAWIINLIYYRAAPHRNFIIPGLVASICFAVWQCIMIIYLGPSTALENLSLIRASAEGVAFSFNLSQISTNVGELTARSVYMGALLPGLIYGFIVSLPRNNDGQKWGILYILCALNLIWFVIASIGWIRYAFLGLALSSVFIARLFYDAADGFQFGQEENRISGYLRSVFRRGTAYRWALVIWLVAIVVVPMGKNVLDIVITGPSAAQEMATYLNKNVRKDALIETWDPEMGFLTDHDYHFPPNQLLALAIRQVYSNGEPVHGYYDFVQTEHPDYLLLGEFSRWVNIYPIDQFSSQYSLVKSVSGYDLYERIK
jgi:hypothetical protein